MKAAIILFFVFFTAFPAFSQREGDNWVFGNRHWISFASGAPQVKTGAGIISEEGSASISDAQGNLLFYTNGVNVWNNQHGPMPNGTGLIGGTSSAQNSVIVPHPADKNLYFIFTAADLTSGTLVSPYLGLHMVNMALDGGRGDVTTKNVVLLNNITSESVTATRDCSGKGYWVLTHSKGASNVFYAFHITAAGLSPNPLVWTIPSVPDEDYRITRIKVSPDGKMLAVTENSGGSVPALALYDFDNATGEVSNKRELMNTKGEICYGASFSPDGTKLYASQSGSNTNPYFENSLAQFTVDLPTAAAIRASKVNLPHYDGGNSSPQLARDGKIYMNHDRAGKLYLSVVEDPNRAGAACNYRPYAFLVGNNPTEYFAAFVNIPDFYFLPGEPVLTCAKPEAGFTADTVCAGNTVNYTDTSKYAPSQWKWTFEGGEPAVFEGQSPPPVLYKNAGNFKTTLIAANTFGADTVEQVVTVRPLPVADAGPDAVVCPGSTAQIGAPAVQGNSYSWTPAAGLSNPNIAQPTATPATEMKYYLTVKNEFGCEARDSVVLKVGEIVAAVDPSDTAICSGSSVTLTASGGSQYEWSPAAGLSATQGAVVIATPALTTQYRLIASSGTCHDTTFLKITVHETPAAQAGRDTALCAGESIELGMATADPAHTYRWTPKEGLSNENIANPLATPDATTQYILEVTNTLGCTARDTVLITIGDQLTVDAGNDTAVCNGTKTPLNAVSNNPEALFQWTPATGLSDANIANPVADPAVTTTYYVTAFKNNRLCSAVDSVIITVLKTPDFETRDTTLYTGETAELQVISSDENITYSWTPADGLSRTDIHNPVVTAFKTITYTITATNENGCTKEKTLTVTVPDKQQIFAVLKAERDTVEPGETAMVFLSLRSENSEPGIHSFKTRVTYDKTVFQYAPGIKFLKGADNSWVISAQEVAHGELMIQGSGATPLFDAEIGFALDAYLAKQADENILLKPDEFNGEPADGNQRSRDIHVQSTKITVSAVCGGDLRYVNLGEFETRLQKIAPNPVTSEHITIGYSVGIEDRVMLEIYNRQGEVVKTLLKGDHKAGNYSAGLYTGELPAGVYVCRFSTMQSTHTEIFVVVK